MLSLTEFVACQHITLWISQIAVSEIAGLCILYPCYNVFGHTLNKFLFLSSIYYAFVMHMQLFSGVCLRKRLHSFFF